MSEQEAQRQDTDKQEMVKPEAPGIVELNAEETEQVVGGYGRQVPPPRQNR